MLKMRDMRDELLWYKKQLPVAHTSVLQDSSSYINGNCADYTLVNENYREASVEFKWSEVAAGRKKLVPIHGIVSLNL
jgi:hypothetical protein